MIGERRPAPGGVALSSITLGTMRLGNVADIAAATRLLQRARDLGITTFHCSSEYGSFPLFQTAWREAALGSSAQVIAKVGVPHFGETSFSAAAFRTKIEAYLTSLSIPRLDVVQWLLRYDLQQEDARVRILHEAADEIAEIVTRLKDEGKIAALIGFPYTVGIAEGLIAADYCDGLALYINPLEHELDPLIARAGRANKAVVAIRPYAAGRVFSETDISAEGALRYVFSHPEVVTAVTSASSEAHLEALVPFLKPAASA